LPFRYNRSGLEVEHAGLQWVPQKLSLNGLELNQSSIEKSDNSFSSNNTIQSQQGVLYKFVLKPVYKIAEIRKGSPAALAGLKVDDVLISINKNDVINYSLEQIIGILKSENDEQIIIEVERENSIIVVRFYPKDLL
jgi:C-terminal processing protease CtpA/Prc